MTQHKFCLDKQQHNNFKPFPVYVLEIEEVETVMTVSNMVYEPGMCT